MKIVGAIGDENKILKDWPAETRKTNTNSQAMDTKEINCKTVTVSSAGLNTYTLPSLLGFPQIHLDHHSFVCY